jgi:hypothetical protein
MKDSCPLVNSVKLLECRETFVSGELPAKGKSVGEGEEGFVTVVTVLMMLLLLTIVGVSAIDNAVIETSVVRNNAFYTRNFYLAESAGYEAAQRLENATLSDTNPTGSLAWIIPLATDMTLRSNWIDTNDAWTNSVRPESFYTATPTNPSNLEILLPGSYVTDDLRLAAHFQGVAQGSSLKVTNQQGRLYGYNVYGMYSNLSQGFGEVLIEMGYKKRF